MGQRLYREEHFSFQTPTCICSCSLPLIINLMAPAGTDTWQQAHMLHRCDGIAAWSQEAQLCIEEHGPGEIASGGAVRHHIARSLTKHACLNQVAWCEARKSSPKKPNLQRHQTWPQISSEDAASMLKIQMSEKGLHFLERAPVL